MLETMTDQLPTRRSGVRDLLHGVPSVVWFVLFYVVLFIFAKFGNLSVLSAISLAVLVPSIIIHEVSHGLMALACGDDTARRAGRLTLNPLRHVDLVGTFILPIVFIVTTGSGFGFAKPVPIDLARTRKPRHASLLISFAGPASNIAVALICLGIGQITDVAAKAQPLSEGEYPIWILALFMTGVVNLWLALFNLLPIPPLDGSAIVERLLPAKALPGYFKFRSLSIVLVIALIFFIPGPLAWLSSKVWVFFANQLFG